MSKVILISEFSLPFSKIGSWTTLYNNYLLQNKSIDFIVCPEEQNHFESIKYSFIKRTLYHKIIRKFLRRKKVEYISAVNEILNCEETYVIQLVDNYGMVQPLHDFLVKKGIRDNCYIQFFYHGFSPYQQTDSAKKFYNLIDEIVVLTDSSYNSFRNKVVVLPNYFSVLNNGIDTFKFKSISDEEKLTSRESLGLGDKKVFLWCSQDRPKKGLNMILDAWSKIYVSDKNIVLLVIGCEPREATEGVQYLGKLPNDHLPKYYQAADCYLFPTLCHEGFGMSLIEALHCGCYCIASQLGGVPEVLQYGQYGKLIENPHFVSEWVSAINEFLQSDFLYPLLPKELYSTQTWNMQMNMIIEEAKNRIEKRNTI